jgi:uncharacterized protein HemY
VKSAPEDASYLETLGAALYRAGEFKAAVEHLARAMEKRQNGGTVWQELFLAMAHHRLGEAEEGRAWQQKALRQIEESKNPAWEDRVCWQHLRQEAEQTLETPSKKP